MFLLIAVVGSLILAAASWAREVVVTKHNGRQLWGELIADTDESITVSISGNSVIIPREQVRSVEAVKTRQQEKARRPVKSVNKKPPTERGWPVNRLSQEQVNLIRVLEIDLKEKPTVVVPSKVIDEMFKYQLDGQLLGKTERRKFKGRRGWQQLKKMFELALDNPQIRSLYKRVKVSDDPPAMLTFRKRIHRLYVLNYCGATNCHGGGEGGDLQLFRERPTHVATVYTNFFMLNSFKAKFRYDIIDRDKPSRSLLIQYSLPPADALEPHPQVEGWVPLLHPQRGTRLDPRALMVIDWINTLYRPSPDYMIEFKPVKQEQKHDGPGKAEGKLDADKVTLVQ